MQPKLSSGSLPKSGGNQGAQLSAKTLSTGAGAYASTGMFRIDPNATRIRYTPAELPKLVPDALASSMNDFMSVAAESAFRYQERESKYFAQQAVNQFNQRASDIYHGQTTAEGKFVPGYESTIGVQTVQGYQGYVGQLDEMLAETLAGLDERTRQKALNGLSDAKQTYVNKGATHRVKQFKKLEEQDKFAQLETVKMQMAESPDSIRVPDADGFTLKQRAFSNFDEPEQAQKWWNDQIAAMPQTVYWNKYYSTVEAERGRGASQDVADAKARDAGYQAALVYATTYAQGEITDSIVENRMLNRLDTLYREALGARADLSQIQADQQEAYAEALERDASGRIIKAITDRQQGLPSTYTDQDFAADAKFLEPKDALAYRAALYDNDNVRVPTEIRNSVISDIYEGKSWEEITAENPALGDFKNRYYSNSHYNQALSMWREHQDDALKTKKEEAQDYVKAMTTLAPESVEASLQDYFTENAQEHLELIAKATAETNRCIGGQGTVDKCVSRARLKFSLSQPSQASLRAIKLKNSVLGEVEYAINDIDDYNMVQGKINQRHQEIKQMIAEGNYTQTQQQELEAELQLAQQGLLNYKRYWELMEEHYNQYGERSW